MPVGVDFDCKLCFFLNGDVARHTKQSLQIDRRLSCKDISGTKCTNECFSYLIRPPCVEPCFSTGAHVADFTVDGFFAFTLVFCNRFIVNGNTYHFPSPLSTFTRN